MISPLHKVTIPSESRAAFGIPLNASYFAFVYPAKDLDEVLSSLNLNCGGGGGRASLTLCTKSSGSHS